MDEDGDGGRSFAGGRSVEGLQCDQDVASLVSPIDEDVDEGEDRGKLFASGCGVEGPQCDANIVPLESPMEER